MNLWFCINKMLIYPSVAFNTEAKLLCLIVTACGLVKIIPNIFFLFCLFFVILVYILGMYLKHVNYFVREES